MDSSGLKSGPDVSRRDENKRPSKPSVKALQNQIERLQADRQAKVNKIKGATKAIKGLMQIDDNAPSVQSQNVSVLLEDAGQLHEAVIQLLPQEEQGKQNAWFSSILAHNSGFMEDVKGWLSEVGEPTKQGAAQIVTDDTLTIPPQLYPPCVEPLEAQINEGGSCVPNQPEGMVGNSAVVDE